MNSNLMTLAERLKAKLDGAKEQNLVVADRSLVELMDANLDVVGVSAAHGSIHGSVGSNASQQ